MIKKTEAEMERFLVAKATRTLVRLKHSLNADREINEVLPSRIDDFNKALARGELTRLELE